MFEEVSDHNTQETYLGHNMADAIACFQDGRWPTGLEMLEGILGRQGNSVTIDDMFLLMQTNTALFNSVRSKCYAVRTCLPDPEHEHGGCSRQQRPGCQTFVSNIGSGHQPYFRRGGGGVRAGVCEDCPIASEAGLREVQNRSLFRGETLKLGVHRFNRITTTDVLLLNYQRPAGGAPSISVGQRGHRLKFNKPGELEQTTLIDMFSALAEDAEPKIDVDEHGTVFVDRPFISRSSDASDWETVYEVENDDNEWEISITNFSPTRIRYFVGSVDPSRALHEFVERVPRGHVHDQRVRLRVEDSLLVWLPSPSDADAASKRFLTWEERLGGESMAHVQAMLQSVAQRRHVFLSVLEGFPGVFLFVKNSKEVLLKPYIHQFLHRHGQLIDRRILVPKFVQDVDSIRFFWNGLRHANHPLDDGGKPEFILNAGEQLNLLTQISKKSSSLETVNGSEQAVSYPTVEVYIFEHIIGSNPRSHKIQAKVKPNDFGFAWLPIQFSKPGQYHLCMKNTGDTRQRWIQLVVMGEAADDPPFSYQTQGGDYQDIDSGQPWGEPSEDSRLAIIQFNSKQLLQGLEGLEELMQTIVAEGHQTIQLGHIAEIARLIFHHHSKEFQGHQTIQLGAFERRLRAIVYNLQALYNLEVNSNHNLMRYLRALGEFEYWGRADGYENHHKLVAQPTQYGVWASLDSSSPITDQIVDARPSNILRESFPSLQVDSQSGIRFIDRDDYIDLGVEDLFVLHSNEKRVAPTADVFLKSFWGAVREEATPLPPADGWVERRWDPSTLADNGRRRATIPANRWRITRDIAERLYRGWNTPGWVKRNRWHEIASIQVSPSEHLFLSLRYSNQEGLDEVNWEMWLGCLNNENMTERFVLLVTRQASDEDQPWIDELGNIGADSGLTFPWLSDPDNALFDPTYLMREVARSITNIVERGREESVQQTQLLSNRGLPGWVFMPHVAEDNLIETRIAALLRYYDEHLEDEELPTKEMLESKIYDDILIKFGWVSDEN
jgi:hypothetical protein